MARVKIGSTAWPVLALSLILMIFALTTLGLRNARQAAWADAEASGRNITASIAGELARTLATLDISLRSTMRAFATPGLHRLTPEEQHVLLFEGEPNDPNAPLSVILDATGKSLHASNVFPPVALDLSGRDYYRRHRDQSDLGLYFGHPVRTATTDEWVLTLSRRIEDPEGAFAGVAAVALRLAEVQRRFAPIRLGAGTTLALLHTDGRLIMRQPFEAEAIGQRLTKPDAFADGLAEGDTAGRFTLVSPVDGVERLHLWEVVPGTPLLFSIGLPIADIEAAWRDKAFGLATVLLALLGVLLALALALRRELARRTRAEAAARASAQDLTLLAEHAQDSLLRVDRSGRRGFVSPSGAAILGMPAEQLLGADWRAPAHPDDRWRLDRVLAALEPGKRITPFSYRARHSGGGWRWIEVAGRALPDGSGAILVERDVSERVALDRRLRQRQRVEAVGRLTAGVAHDFNNLLTTLLGSLELLQDSLADRPEAKALARTAMQMGERGARLTHQLLSFSRQQVLQPVPVAPGALLSRLAETLNRTLGPQHPVVVEVEPDLPRVLADAAHLETALLNLVLNARDALPRGGSIQLLARMGKGDAPAELARSAVVVIAVGDRGAGMDNATLRLACEPFFSTKGHGGTGLGLSTAQGFARQSGGELVLRSAPGMGTLAELWLPAVAESALPAPVIPAASMPEEAVAGRRVLLVDDSPDVLLTLGAFLDSAGYAVSAQPSAEAALAELAAGAVVDVLVTDYVMPGLSGADLIARALQLRPDLPALIVTGYAEADALARLEGRWEVLRKPFRRDELLRAIGELLRSTARETVPASEPAASERG